MVLKLKSYISTKFNVFIHDGSKIIDISVVVCNYSKLVAACFDVVAKLFTKK